MNSYIGKVFSNFRDFYNEINTATLTGAIDVVVVEQADGSYHCSPFHVRFGKLGVLRSREKVVDIEINGEPLDIQMKLGESGEAFFVEEVASGELGDDEFIPPHLATSPIPSEPFLSRYHDEQRAAAIAGAAAAAGGWLDAGGEAGGWAGEVTAVSAEEISLLVSPGELKESDLDEREHIADGVKTFRAETMEGKVSEKVRRISIVTGEFRPISMEPPLEPSCKIVELPAEAAVETAVEAAVEVAAEVVPVGAADEGGPKGAGGRKKRKKKALTKKKGGNKKSAGGSIGGPTEAAEAAAPSGLVQPPQAVDDVAAENIFQIDDLGDSFDQTDSMQQDSFDQPSESAATPGESRRAKPSANVVRGLGGAPLSISLPPLGGCQAAGAGGGSGTIADEVASCMKHANTETNFHFFSDTEVTPGSSPLDSRPNTPIQSDTEAERVRHSEASGAKDDDGSDVAQSWRWGELPSPPPKLPPGVSRQTSAAALAKDPGAAGEGDDATHTQDAAAAEAAHRSIISHMFSFMKKTKRLRHDGGGSDGGGGIYLADINADELDPEVAALYFPASYRQMHPQPVEGPQHDEDNESGKGTSLPQSPLPQSPPGTDSDHHQQYKPLMDSLCMSLCGGLNDPAGVDPGEFDRKRVTFDAYSANVDVLQHPDLVIRFEDKYYSYKTALPMVLSLLLYKRPLAQHPQERLAADGDVGEMEPPAAVAEAGAEGEPTETAAAPEGNAAAVAAEGKPGDGMAAAETAEAAAEAAAGRGGYTSWFSWRKSAEQPPKKQQPPQQQRQDDTAARDAEVERIVGSVKDSKEVLIPNRMGLASQSSNFQGTPKSEAIPVPTDKKEDGYNGSNSSDGSDSGMAKLSTQLALERRGYYEHAADKFRKTLRLSSAQIARLNLQDGANEVVFSVTTAYQGTTRCKCHIYKWRHDDRIVISDIDGTITKSDVLGHILPIVGKDWAQSGVAQLFTKIKNNGYKLLYLSARAIGQARVTREYLRSIRQGDLSLPDGPLLLNPTSLISAFHREVIEKKPEEFKISCLRDIHALFPVDSKPFYAGYGNKVNDVWAYRAVGIPIFRIFTINHRGELKHELTQTFQSSYTGQSCIVNDLFPIVIN